MIETLTVITVSVLLLIFFRPGKTPPLDNPLIIERSGKYRIVLAPKLNLAQPFIEALVKRMESLVVDNEQCSATLFYSLRDANISKRGNKEYLLAVIYIGGMFHFQASWPLSSNPSNYLETIKALSSKTIREDIAKDKNSEKLEASLNSLIQTIADERAININLLTQ